MPSTVSCAAVPGSWEVRTQTSLPDAANSFESPQIRRSIPPR
jgi:hypothetical protein